MPEPVWGKRTNNVAKQPLMRLLGLVGEELVSRYPNNLAVLPSDHWQTESLMGKNCLIDGFLHPCFDGLVLGMKPV